MELLYIIVGIYLLWKFNRPVTTMVKVVDTSANIADDTIDTYSNEVHILNANKRSKQKAELDELGAIVTNDEINRILAGKRNEPKPAE